MTDKDFSLGVPKPVKGRNVSGFDTPAPAKTRTRKTPEKVPPKPRAAAPAKPRRTARKAATTTRDKAVMVRVHTSLSVETALALKGHAERTRLTQTEILAEALVTHGDNLAEEADIEARSQYEAMGFRRPRRTPRDGRMSTTFYMSTVARKNLDEMATEAGYGGRSSFIDALIRRQLGLPT